MIGDDKTWADIVHVVESFDFRPADNAEERHVFNEENEQMLNQSAGAPTFYLRTGRNKMDERRRSHYQCAQHKGGKTNSRRDHSPGIVQFAEAVKHIGGSTAVLRRMESWRFDRFARLPSS